MTDLRERVLRGTAMSLVLAATALAAPATAFAQATSDPATAAKPATATASKTEATALSEVVVVGTRIRHDTFNSPSPIQVITREESTLSGFNTTTEVLQGTAVTGGSAQINNSYSGYIVNGGPGANTLGLRGLGADRTLVLLNGRRITPAGVQGGVGSADLNVLPDAIVDHIEILKDGASSVYGSDAVAGVVNIVTKKGLNKPDMEAEFSIPGHAGGQERRISVIDGYAADRFSVAGSFEYIQRDSLSLGQRSWARCNEAHFIDYASGASTDYVDPQTGLPKCYPTGLTGENGVTINTIGTATLTGVPAVGSTGTKFNRWRPNAAVTTGLIGFEGIGGANSLQVRDTFDPRMYNESLISPETDYNLFLQGSYDLHALGDAELYAEFLGNRRSSSQIGYRQLSLDYNFGSPLIPSNLAGQKFQTSATLLTTGAVGVRAFIGFGNSHASQQVNFYKPTLGIKGDIPFLAQWRYDFSATYSRSDASYTYDTWLTDRLKDSLQVSLAPAGTAANLVNDLGYTCTSNIGNAAHGCVPAPSLTTAVIGGKLPKAWTDYTFVPVTGNTLYSEGDFNLGVDGPIWKLPYGNLKGAFGMEFRTAHINDTPPLDSQTGNTYNLSAAAPTRGSDYVFETYGELEAPLLANKPLVHELTVNVSGRFTDYHSYGVGWTYKIGGVYAPTDWASVRITYGTSYRAPALFEQYQGASQGFLSAGSDPCNNYQTQPTTSNLYKNCNADLQQAAAATPFQQTSSIEAVTEGGAAVGLKAETSDNFTVGLVLQPKLPTVFGSISFAVDYYKIQINNGVQQIGALNLLDLCYNSDGFRAAGSYCNYVEARGANGQGPYTLTVLNGYTNISTTKVAGLDYTVRYTRDLGPGKLRLNGQLTQYLNQSYKLFPTDNFTDENGTVTSPAYTATFDATYTYKTFKFRYGFDFIGATNSYALIFGAGTTKADATPYVFDTPTYFVHRLAVQYTTNKWELTAGVRNLLDTAPPTISAAYYNRVGTAPLYSGYDYLGRTFYLNLNKAF